MLTGVLKWSFSLQALSCRFATHNSGDIESAILTGEIVERQKDHDSAESKYVIAGETIDDRSITVVAKFGASGRKLYILTVYGNEKR
jgi:hypothetical protein